MADHVSLKHEHIKNCMAKCVTNKISILVSGSSSGGATFSVWPIQIIVPSSFLAHPFFVFGPPSFIAV